MKSNYLRNGMIYAKSNQSTIRLHQLICFVSIILLITTISSCKKDDKELVDLDPTEIDTLAWDRLDSISNPPSINQFDITIARGATWRAWRKIHKDCMKNAWFKDGYYVGVSNTIDLGSIIDRGEGLQLRLKDAFTDPEIQSFIQLGAFKNCGIEQQFSINVNAMLQGEVDVNQDMDEDIEAELIMKIQSSKKSSIKVDNWRINTLVEKVMRRILTESKEKTKADFLEELDNANNTVITSVIEIQGFSTTIEFETEISPELELRLTEGVIANVGSGKFDAELKLKNKKSIQMSSKGSAFVFVKMKKGKDV